MPYKSRHDLNSTLQEKLPTHAQEIYREAFNHAWDTYKDPHKRQDDHSREETAHRVAWAAVKKKYAKNEQTGHWEPL